MPRARRNDKRERLIEAADKLIYEQTFHTTTLADIAKLADVPLGNVYYYFKTKYLEPFSLPAVNKDKQTRIAKLAEKIHEAKIAPKRTDTSTLEREIDEQVYALYGLTPEEIKIVEDSAT